MQEVNGFVFAGGRSSRFGSDKCLYELEGKHLIERVVDVFSALDIVPTIITSKYAAEVLAEIAPTIVDDVPDRGPVQALMQAAKLSSSDHFAVLPCDTPFVQPGTLKNLIRRATDINLDACVASSSDGRLHPLVGCYSASIEALALELLRNGSASVHSLFSRLPNTQPQVVDDQELVNINSLEDARNAVEKYRTLL